MIKVSVITPCYNAEKNIQKTILSVLNQTYKNIEYIIIDGNSSDNTIKIINKYKKKITKIISEPDKGFYDALNKGIRLSRGKFIIILNSGDLYVNKNVIKNYVKEVSRDKNIKILFSNIKIFDENNNLVRLYMSSLFRRYFLYCGIIPGHTTFFCYRKYFTRYGMYSTKFKVAADFDLIYRYLILKKLKYKILDNFMIKMTNKGMSDSGFFGRIKQNLDINKILKKNKFNFYFITFFFKIIFRFYEKILKIFYGRNNKIFKI